MPCKMRAGGDAAKSVEENGVRNIKCASEKTRSGDDLGETRAHDMRRLTWRLDCSEVSRG